MVVWNEFKASLPKEVRDSKIALKVLFIHWSLKLNGLVCNGIGDKVRAGGANLTDKELVEALSSQTSSPRSITYRYPQGNNETICFGFYYKRRGTNLFVVLESTDRQMCVYSDFDLKCLGDRDSKVVQLFQFLRNTRHEGDTGAKDAKRSRQSGRKTRRSLGGFLPPNFF